MARVLAPLPLFNPPSTASQQPTVVFLCAGMAPLPGDMRCGHVIMRNVQPPHAAGGLWGPADVKQVPSSIPQYTTANP
jgi:hypothetical protein